MSQTKENLIEEIKHLIGIDGTSININPNYLEYFELEELDDIKNQLLIRKQNQSNIAKDYLDEIFEKCGTYTI